MNLLLLSYSTILHMSLRLELNLKRFFYSFFLTLPQPLKYFITTNDASYNFCIIVYKTSSIAFAVWILFSSHTFHSRYKREREREREKKWNAALIKYKIYSTYRTYKGLVEYFHTFLNFSRHLPIKKNLLIKKIVEFPWESIHISIK